MVKVWLTVWMQLLKEVLEDLSDEKLFTIAAPTNSQNDRFYVRPGTIKKEVKKLASSNKTDIQQVGAGVGRRLEAWLH